MAKRDLQQLGMQIYVNSPALFVNAQVGEWKQMVKENMFEEVVQPAWRVCMAKSPHLSVFSSAVPNAKFEDKEYKVQRLGSGDGQLEVVRVRRKQKTFAEFLNSSHRRMREFLLTLRAGSLPLQVPKYDSHKWFRCGSLQGGDICFMCGLYPESLDHFVNECSAYSELKNAFQWWGHTTVLKYVYSMAVGHKDMSDLLFQMWSFRMQQWRHTHPNVKQAFLFR
jgi:hypothetical protein